MIVIIFRVELEGRDMTKLKMRGFVTDSALELLSFSGDGSKIQCVKFGNTYYGTDRTECAILFNNGPEPVNFVAVVDEDAIAQELVRLRISHVIDLKYYILTYFLDS